MTAEFWLSEAQGGDPDAEPVRVDCAEGFQLTYWDLRECAQGDTVARFVDGFWTFDDGRIFSDVSFTMTVQDRLG